jgi:hypothetical protein
MHDACVKATLVHMPLAQTTDRLYILARNTYAVMVTSEPHTLLARDGTVSTPLQDSSMTLRPASP